MTNENGDRLHESLCAYVLGEGSEAERAEFERALAESADLRAELDRIEATIGLVRGVMSEGETLSPEAAEQVRGFAIYKPIAWHKALSVRLAAGIAIALGLFGVYEATNSRGRPPAPPIAEGERGVRRKSDKLADATKDDQVAVLSKNEATKPADTDQAARRALQGLGYTGAKERPAVNDANSPFAISPAETTDEIVEDLIVQGAAGSAVPPSAAEALSAVNQIIPREAPVREERYAESRGMGGSANPAPSPSGDRKMKNGLARQHASETTTASDSSGRSISSALSVPPSGGPAAPAPEAPPSLSGATVEALRRLGYVGDSNRSAAGADDFHASKDLKGFDYYSSLSPQQQQHYIDQECRRILTGCYRRPNERPRDMFFRYWGDNPFEIAVLDAQSTFSVDVDTASYALARRYLNEGNLPEKAQIRTEEFVNYFKADVAPPREGTFAIHTDLAPSRFSHDAQRWMMRVVVRGKDVTREERKPLALTFVIDVSGSMKEQNRLEMVKHTLRLLLSQLDGNDSIAIVTFSSDARMVLPMTSAGNRGLIESALYPLQPGGSTNSQAGLRMGYEAALAGLNPNATNRVVFLSDGVANVGVTDPNQITNEIKQIREKGIYLNTVGVGMNNHNDVLLEQLADKGDGVCNYVDTPDEARRVMVDGFTGAFEPIARDVKIQVEFDPAQVERYRLLGYENRAVADRDFRNDQVDAGEVGAGHQVTALYEIVRTSQAAEAPLATVRLRWKAPTAAGREFGEGATEIAQPVFAAQATGFEGAGAGYRRAVIVAQFAEILRRSHHARGESLDDVIAEATKLEREMKDKEFTELVYLMQKSRALILANVPSCDDLCETLDQVRRNQILRAEHELLSKGPDAQWVQELERQNLELEQRIRDLLRQRLQQPR